MTTDSEVYFKNIMENQISISNALTQKIHDLHLHFSNEIIKSVRNNRNTSLEYDLGFQINDIRKNMMKILLKDSEKYKVITDSPVAIFSNDHIAPYGTINDNTRHPRFVKACERFFRGRRLKALDLGCSGGGLVFDFLFNGHVAVGLEGSDASFKASRAEWRTIPENLFTCDVTRPFTVRTEGSVIEQFDVVTMWEVLEHIQETDLPVLFANINNHLSMGGVFIGSIALQDDVVNWVSYHPTVRPI